jgi:glutathione synthase/RimK-type ligase-like ATP-grasp enzyme
MQRAKVIVIVSEHNDLHALIIQHMLINSGTEAILVQADRLAYSRPFTWRCYRSSDHGPGDVSLAERITVSEVDAVWWRRSPRCQNHDLIAESSPEDRTLIERSCHAALLGALYPSTGTWISDPWATDRASNKLVQLNAAHYCGFTIPDTLVTQDVDEVGDFLTRHSQVVAKPLTSATGGMPLFTTSVSEQDLASRAVSACPTIYQEYIPGNCHYRVNVFGEDIISFTIESPLLDWRQDMRCACVRPTELPGRLPELIKSYLERLGLHMGIFDFKMSTTGDLYLLELNPQGQFLFLEGLTGYPLAARFTDFLCRIVKEQSPH